MKIPIKFRGRDLDLGEYVYGEFGQGATSGEPMIYFYDKDAQQWVGAAVDPDSVAQLVGYDVDGKEVYEGDKLVDILGNEYTATIRIELTCDDKQSYTGKAYYAGTVDNLKLKEKAA